MTDRAHNDEIRCDCGRLLARRVSGGIEVKCRRCDRIITIQLEDLPADGAFVEPDGRG